jgi:hypothetical protein
MIWKHCRPREIELSVCSEENEEVFHERGKSCNMGPVTFCCLPLLLVNRLIYKEGRELLKQSIILCSNNFHCMWMRVFDLDPKPDTICT